ncbi:hypothetical protein L226DRAFT_90159 [Lentinus tigrinus ALCF2SS1-7]|uniref:uncharacterized protein n=1 Tax=Lentinus tigrinus ALCF2SS1-7 TaxID=1328758 RepID=UPI001165DCBA|nr:hypothetical protein L226DRAFT_90159 [Lentinus tigrinus ALCF2SS1-7]
MRPLVSSFTDARPGQFLEVLPLLIVCRVCSIFEAAPGRAQPLGIWAYLVTGIQFDVTCMPFWLVGIDLSHRRVSCSTYGRQ